MNTPGIRVGPGFRNRTLAIKRRKNTRKSVFFVNFFLLNDNDFFIFLLFMPKYEGKQNVSFLSIPEVVEM